MDQSDGSSAENPFRKALEEAEIDYHPLDGPGLPRERPRTVADMNLVKPEVLAQIPKVAKLTVQDLEDLASEFHGIPTDNPNVAALTLEDITDLESVFFEFKLAVGRDLARPLRKGARDVAVSCCSCTPCSCCAAVDMSIPA